MKDEAGFVDMPTAFDQKVSGWLSGKITVTLPRRYARLGPAVLSTVLD
ncbi:hypothetical protein ABGB18_19345 [Nonomuraea sp. B12E4]